MIKSKIEWTESTINFWMGCNKISAGCKNCYMFRAFKRYGRDPNKILRTKKATFRKALKWETPQKIFTNSWSDFFIEEADGWRNEAWDVIRKTPHHTWQILTKRPERIKDHLPSDWGNGYQNVWLGVSVEDQKSFHRAKSLSEIPAKVRFISAEPLLEELNLLQLIEQERVIDAFDWIIIGGESGNDIGQYGYRECKIEWIDKIVTDLQNEAPHVKIFIKQLGTHLKKELKLKGKRHGGEIDKWPSHLRIRDYPN